MPPGDSVIARLDCTYLPRNRMDDDGRGQSTATIEAKPQIKNVGGDVTRFMPTSLRIKREARDSKGRLLRPSGEMIIY